MTPIVAVLQARMNSTRLPGKSLCPLAGVPLIEHIINRLKAVTDLDRIVLAVPDSPSEDPLTAVAARLGVSIVKGPEEDVLARFLMAADAVDAEHIVRVCGDNPLIDRALIRSLIQTHLEKNADYSITSDSIPLGTGTEVVRVAALRRIAQTTDDPKYREHVTTWFHDHPDEGVQPRVPAPAYLRNKPFRLTVDTEKDLALMEQIFEHFHTTPSSTPDLEQVIRFLDTHPEIARLNAEVPQKDWRTQSE
ncbi:MAG: glycosyltransferase family protein [Nitrospinae bacterium]|nr:glycosyltransferase family protein [Nitrospinota bacterium]